MQRTQFPGILMFSWRPKLLTNCVEVCSLDMPGSSHQNIFPPTITAYIYTSMYFFLVNHLICSLIQSIVINVGLFLNYDGYNVTSNYIANWWGLFPKKEEDGFNSSRFRQKSFNIFDFLIVQIKVFAAWIRWPIWSFNLVFTVNSPLNSQNCLLWVVGVQNSVVSNSVSNLKWVIGFLAPRFADAYQL